VDVLLNWVAQGGLVVLAAAAVLRLIPRSRTTARYWFAWAACVVVLGLPAVPHIVAVAFPLRGGHDAAAALPPLVSMPIAWWTSTACVVVLWMLWCGVCGIRLAAAAIAVRAARRRSRSCPPAVQARLRQWSRVAATGRRARLVLSPGVRSAAVLGCGAPMIALAPALLEHLDDDDLDRVVLHEWAHVQRRDDVAQVIERIVTMVAGWHPAVWWLQRQLALEREVACDEIAVALTGSAKGYAACLVTLASLRLPPVRAVPAPAVLSSAGLRRRLVRILAPAHGIPRRRWRAIAICSSVALACLALAVGSVRVAEMAATASSVPGAARPHVQAEIAALVSATVPQLQDSAAVASVTPRRSRSAERGRPPQREPNVFAADAASPAPESLLASAVGALPSQPVGWLIEVPTSAATSLPPRTAVNAGTETDSAAPAADAGPPPGETRPGPWTAIADAAVALGRGPHSAGVATAGFFRRFGKQIAGSF
jgi:beta-lactamase regulating signal transducer with metallopeptidase domain